MPPGGRSLQCGHRSPAEDGGSAQAGGAVLTPRPLGPGMRVPAVIPELPCSKQRAPRCGRISRPTPFEGRDPVPPPSPTPVLSHHLARCHPRVPPGVLSTQQPLVAGATLQNKTLIVLEAPGGIQDRLGLSGPQMLLTRHHPHVCPTPPPHPPLPSALMHCLLTLRHSRPPRGLCTCSAWHVTGPASPPVRHRLGRHCFSTPSLTAFCAVPVPPVAHPAPAPAVWV